MKPIPQIAFGCACALALAGISSAAYGTARVAADETAVSMDIELAGTDAGRAPSAYAAGDRRDPFVPWRPEGVPEPVAQDPDIPTIDELVLVGIIEGPEGEPVALFHGGREEKGWFLRKGTWLRDGYVHEVNDHAGVVVFRQPAEDTPTQSVEVVRHLHR